MAFLIRFLIFLIFLVLMKRLLKKVFLTWSHISLGKPPFNPTQGRQGARGPFSQQSPPRQEDIIEAEFRVVEGSKKDP